MKDVRVPVHFRDMAREYLVERTSSNIYSSSKSGNLWDDLWDVLRDVLGRLNRRDAILNKGPIEEAIAIKAIIRASRQLQGNIHVDFSGVLLPTSGNDTISVDMTRR